MLLATFNIYNRHIPIENTVPGIAVESTLYKEAEGRITALYKAWKNRILELAHKWFVQWSGFSANVKYQNEARFSVLVQAVAASYSLDAAADVFRFAQSAVDFNRCTASGKEWIKCMFTYNSNSDIV